MADLTLIIILVTLAFISDFLNGFHGSANVVATMIASRAMTPRAALVIAASANFIGPFLFGVAVAKTVGEDVVVTEAVTISVLISALLGASIWNFLTWYFGLPSSSTHALIGGLVGAVIIASGPSAIKLAGVWKIVTSLLVSPVAGFLVGMALMRLVIWLVRDATPQANIFFKLIQVPTAIGLALSHGTNNAQKTMGIITLGLVVIGYQDSFEVPIWVILASATAISSGTAIGGWRIIRTLANKFYRIRPIHGFTSQLTSATVILSASLLGGPVSTTHVVSSSILGVGAAQRKSQVRWGVMADILAAWVFTVPASALIAVIFSAIIGYISDGGR